jgi:hypothetical protein
MPVDNTISPNAARSSLGNSYLFTSVKAGYIIMGCSKFTQSRAIRAVVTKFEAAPIEPPMRKRR